MEPEAPATGATPRNATEPSQSQPQQPPSSLPPSSSSTPPISTPPQPSPNPNPNPNPNPIQNAIPRPPIPTPRPLTSFIRNPPPPQQSHFPHFSSLPPSSGPPSASSFQSTPTSTAAPRGGMAIGVPAHHQNPSPPFSSSFGQHFGGLGRTDSNSNSSTSQVRAPIPGMGMLGSLGSSSQMRPGGMPSHPQRPVQSSLRPPPSTQNSQPAGPQSFQGHGLMRPSSVGSPAAPSPSQSQNMQSINQPWLSSGPPGKPPLPSQSYRQQMNQPSLQQRPHISPQQQSTPTPSQPQQPSPSNQSQEHFGQQVPSSRAPHVPHQQQVTRIQGPGNQKPSSLMAAQASAVQPGGQSRFPNRDTDELSKSVLSKRSIHELVNQVDPLEKLDPELADILGEFGEDFFESITRFGCSLAKHRKSSILEAKDILLHLEKAWNMTLPGFAGDEIKNYRKQPTSDIHKERIMAIRKSLAAAEAAHAKGSAAQASGSAKGSQGKTPLNIIGSPNLKGS